MRYFFYHPFALSLSKGSSSLVDEEVKGFDKFSPNGFVCLEATL